MKLRFEHDFQQKIMQQQFDEPYTVDSPAAVQIWRSAWMQELKSWHSPYKLMIDCSNLIYAPSPATDDAMDRMLRFFEGLFLKSVVGFGFDASKGHDKLKFKVLATFEDAQREVGARGLKTPSTAQNFRDSIQFQNHFAQHVIEMSFADEALVDSAGKIADIKSKLTNNLMQWHSKWSLLIDCSRLSFDASIQPEWQKFESYLRGFFMKAIVGYSPSNRAENHYPFRTFRARHAAVAQLENEGHFMGSEAHCRTKS